MTESIIYLHFRESNAWYRHLCHIGYSHVTVYRQTDHGCFRINANDKFLSLTSNVLPTSKKNEYRLKISCVLGEIEAHRLNWLIGKWSFCSCVAIAKYMLGIRGWSQTPYQLFKYLTSEFMRNRNPHIKKVEVI